MKYFRIGSFVDMKVGDVTSDSEGRIFQLVSVDASGERGWTIMKDEDGNAVRAKGKSASEILALVEMAQKLDHEEQEYLRQSLGLAGDVEL